MCYPFKRRPGTDTAKGCAASPHWTYADEKKVPFLEGSAADEAVFKFVVMPHMGGWWLMMTLLIFENDDGGWWLADIQPKDIKPSLTSRRVGHPVRHPAESDIQQVSMKSSFLADIYIKNWRKQTTIMLSSKFNVEWLLFRKVLTQLTHLRDQIGYQFLCRLPCLPPCHPHGRAPCPPPCQPPNAPPFLAEKQTGEGARDTCVSKKSWSGNIL